MKKTPYLEQKVLDKLSRIPFKSKKRLINLNKGFHKSSNKGKNIEFKEHREYTFGDNIKDIDWKIYAKTEDYFIKEFEEEVKANLIILLDTSSSMLNPFAGNTAKIEYAKYICAALSYLFIKQNDNISIATFDSNFNTILYPTNNKNTLTILDEKLRNIKPKNNDKILTDFNIIAKVKNTFKKSPYICFIISDMIAEKSNILQGLAKINSPINQIYILHLIHNLENNFDFNGYVEIKDPESDKSITTKAGDIKDKFIYMYQQYIKNLRKELLNINIDYNAFLMSRHYSDNILDFLKKHKMN